MLSGNACVFSKLVKLLYILLNKACSTYGVGERCLQGLMGKPEVKGRPRLRWKDNVKMDLQGHGLD